MNLESFEDRIGTSFKNKKLLEEALTHRSYLNEIAGVGKKHNERLEFLGDAVLELIVTEDLFGRFPDKEEGELTVLRAALVNSKMLSLAANKIGLTESILMSRGEAKESYQTRAREKISANAMEALIGAIYLDAGYGASKKFIDEFIMSFLDGAIKEAKDAKSMVQEIIQSEFKLTPTYKVLEESGPAHDRTFKVGLYIGDEMQTEALGKSKQEAEIEAARAWLESRG
ncbi:MAG TPA: ribonuclease III [Candidatus Paceibacterota bacterium]